VLPDKGRFGEMVLPMCAHTLAVLNRM